MGAVGAKRSTPLVDEFNGALGSRTQTSLQNTILDAEALLINPHYHEDRVYRVNCALCSTAFALNARGYDVEAMPRDVVWRGFGAVFDVDYSNKDNYIAPSSSTHWSGTPYGIKGNGADLMPRGADAAARKIENKLKSWGDGAYAEMSVKWKGGGGAHSIIVANDGGTVKIIDSQNGRTTTDIRSYLARTVANHTQVTRLDNAPVTKSVQNLNRIVKRKGA